MSLQCARGNKHKLVFTFGTSQLLLDAAGCGVEESSSGTQSGSSDTQSGEKVCCILILSSKYNQGHFVLRRMHKADAHGIVYSTSS
jgi:hypothetical protein